MKTGTVTNGNSPGGRFTPLSLVTIAVPVPPSANNLFATVKRRRVKSAEYRYWLKQVVPTFRTLKPVAGPCRVNVTIDGEVNMQRDGDNFIKPIHDALVESGVIAGDSLKFVREGWWKHRDTAGPATVTVWLVPVDD